MGNNQQKSNPPPLPLPLPSPRVEETPPAPSRSITQQYSVGSPPTAHHQNPPCHNNGGPSDACSTSSMTQVSENECVKMMMMDPATIRYTQTKFPRTFSRPSLLMKNGPNQLASTSRGVSYSMALKTIQPQLQLSWLLSQLQAGHLKVDSIPSIRVFFYNDYWYSLDNRRLWVFKQYGAPIPVTVTTSLSDFLHKFQLDGDNQSPKFIPESDIRTHSIAETKDGEKQDLIQLLFGYTIDDIMDEDLLQIKMNAIPETFNTPSEYFSSFKWPLVEEVRAQLQQALEEINEAPCIPILEVFKPERSQQSKYAEGFIQLKLCFDPNDMKLCSDPNDIPGEDEKQFQFKAKDLVLLSTNSGSSLEQLSQWSIMGFISRTPELEEVEEMEEVEERQVSESTSSPVEYHILVKRNIRAAIYEALLDNEKTWYAFYLVGLVPAYRTWQALHYSGANQEDYPIIRETLQYHPAQDLLELNAIPAKKELKDNIMSYCSFMRLNGSQAHAIATVLCDVKAERNPGVRMIQGPPGTGKTSTIVGILSVATGTGMKCLTVCPTNAAIATVALRYMGMLQSHEEKQFGEFCKSSEGIECKVLGKGDVILIGTEEKLPVKGPLKDIYLPKRVKRLKMASRGWYEAATRFSKRINPKIDCHQDEDTELETTEELVKKLKEHSNTLSLDLSGRHVEVFLTTAKLVAEFLRLEEDLRGQASAELENVLERGFGIVRRNFLSNDSIENLCLRSSSLIFCTVSTAGRMCVKQAAPFKCLIIDEAAQLVEAETAIVTTLPGLNHAILVGDQHQLPATVISKAATECAYGRSLFERMMCLGHPSHLLNKQYRMHPAISLFPSSRFYQSHMYDGDNVRSDAYKVHEKLLYGPYAFLDVNDGSEQTGDDGKSKKNLVEASVIVALVRTLRKACLEVNTGSLTVGIITPYSSQKDHLKQCFLKQRTEPLIVDVNSVDGFQGQERDIIIVSTVRANKRGVIGFLKDYRRLNVAITRARYCLWIVGCSKTLSAKQNIWALRLKDVNQRGLFKRVNDGELANAVIKAKRDLGEYIDLLQMGSAFFSNMLWKVLFSNTFKNAFVKLRSLEKRHKILYKIRRLGLGHHASSHKIKMQELEGLVEVHMVADLCLIWSIDVERDSEVQQIIKVWDVIDYSTLSIYVKRLQNAFNVYSEGYMQRCKTRQLTWDNSLTRPATWKESSDFVWLKPHEKCAQRHEKTDLLTESSTVSESLLLMKFYAMSSGIAKNLLTASDGVELELPFEVNEEESIIIKYPSSCFVLGRSGTGKTTVLVTKLIQREQQCRVSQDGFNYPDLSQGVLENSNKAHNGHIKQILVTLSPLLCAAIKKQISQIQSTLSAEGESPMARDFHYELILDTEDEDRILGHLPENFIDIPQKHYPLILTFRKFLAMLNNSLSFAKNTMKGREVHYEQFDSEYWPHMDHSLTRKFDSCTVYTEIVSVIKGSIQAVKTTQGFLDNEKYLSCARKGQQLSLDQKEMIYRLFLQYEKLKMQRDSYDMADYIRDVYKQLASGAYRGDKIDFLYIDEVQDFTTAQISLFGFLCSDPQEGYIFAGDTAQTIARGVNFRFQEARSLFYTDFGRPTASATTKSGDRKTTKEFTPAFFQLSHNFRTHVGVVNMANSIVQLLYYFFPQCIDKLDPETSLVWGQLPVLLKADGHDLAKEICRTNKETNNKGHGFGAQQVILVRDDAQKTDLVNKLGKKGLILTVSGSKGLEFEDVLLYNFFTGSSLQNDWKVVYNYVYQNKLMAEHDPTRRSYPAFDVHKHSLLCSELKHVYVAVTRARQRLWIYEENDRFCQPLIDYWMCQDLIETKLLNEAFISQMAANSTPDEWKKRGFEVFNQHQYDMAILCFERAGDQHNADLAKAASLRQYGEKHFNINRDSAIANLKKASEMFIALQRPEIAAKCCIKYGDYDNAGLIYSKDCKPPRFEDGGDCFLEAKNWLEAEKAYFEGKCIEKCLRACLLAKHHERGLTFISKWTLKQSTDVEHMDVYLKACADTFYHQQNVSSMMMFVNALSDIELKRAFLRAKNCLAELLSIEEAAKNYLQAAELAELTGDLLYMTELLEKGGKFTRALKGLLFLLRMDFFWGEQRKGWPLQTGKKPEDLLKRVQKLAALVEDCVRREAELEVFLFFEKTCRPEDVLAHGPPSNNLKTKLFTNWKGINSVLKIFQNVQHIKDNNLHSLQSFQADNALFLKLVNMYVEWQDVILRCKEAISGDAQDNSTREFCYEFFAVKNCKETQTCVVYSHEAYWFRGYRRGKAPIKISDKEFSDLTARFWDEQVNETGKSVITAISNHLATHHRSLQRLDIVERSKLLLDLTAVANKLAMSLHSSQGIQALTNTLQREMEMLLWPPLRQEKQMLLVQRLRMTTGVVAFLDTIANNSTSIKQRPYTMEETARLQLMFPFLSDEWKSSNLNSLIQKAEFWKDVDMWPSNVLGNVELPINEYVLKFGEQLLHIFDLEWKSMKNYISPLTFVTLVEKAIVMACACNTLLHGTLLPLTLAVDFMCGEGQETINKKIIHSTVVTHQKLVELIRAFAIIVIELLFELGVSEWFKHVGADAKAELPPMVQRLFIILLVICINSREPTLTVHIVRTLEQGFVKRNPQYAIMKYLPEICKLEIRKACQTYDQRGVGLERAFAKALSSMGDTLVMMKRCKGPCCYRPQNGVRTVDMGATSTSIFSQLAAIAGFEHLSTRLEGCSSVKTCNPSLGHPEIKAFEQHNITKPGQVPLSEQDVIYSSYLKREAYRLKIAEEELLLKIENVKVEEGNDGQILLKLDNAKRKLQEELCYLNPSHEKHLERDLEWLRGKVDQAQESHGALRKIFEQSVAVVADKQLDDDDDVPELEHVPGLEETTKVGDEVGKGNRQNECSSSIRNRKKKQRRRKNR